MLKITRFKKRLISLACENFFSVPSLFPSFNFFRSVHKFHFSNHKISACDMKDFNYIFWLQQRFLSCLHNDQLPYLSTSSFFSLPRSPLFFFFFFWKISIRLENVCISVSLVVNDHSIFSFFHLSFQFHILSFRTN